MLRVTLIIKNTTTFSWNTRLSILSVFTFFGKKLKKELKLPKFPWSERYITTYNTPKERSVVGQKIKVEWKVRWLKTMAVGRAIPVMPRAHPLSRGKY